MAESIVNLQQILEKAQQRQALKRSEIIALLEAEGEDTGQILGAARALRNRYFQNEIFLYGFIYFSTWCRNDCAFCYYRQSNQRSIRYRKSETEILDAAGSLAASGVHLIDLTSGEDADCFLRPGGYELLAELVRTVKTQFALPVMLSPGVVSGEALQMFAEAGADWYAVYQETHNRALFARLRLDQSYDERLQVKRLARRYGLLVEEGILKGVGETAGDVADSFEQMDRLRAQQVRVMSFVPQPGTPMDTWTTPDRSGELKVIAVMRLLFPDRLIPASLDVDGVAGLQARLNAGANVVTSLIPPRMGLAGVASIRDIDDGCRTVAGILPLLEQMGLAPAAPESYRRWVEAEKRKLSGCDDQKTAAIR